MRAVLAAALLLAGGCREAPEGPPPDLSSDARALREVMVDDPVAGTLEEADEAVLDELPARAARLIEEGALPAARRQVERVEALEMGTVDGRRLHRRLLEAHRARVEALEAYRAALARGEVEDLTLVQALRAQREAHDRLLAVDAEIEAALPGD